MRAINLIPADERKHAGGAAGRSGGAVYVLLGLLALMVAVAVVTTMQNRSIADKRAELVAVDAEAGAAEARATQLGSFTQFAALRAKRVETVSSLASSRFDWSHAIDELARVVPRNVWLTGLQGTVAPGIAIKESAVSGTSTLRSAVPAPAIEMVGCTTDQKAVARMLTRMRLIDGVSRVTLHSSVKTAAAAGPAAVPAGGAASSSSSDCRQGDARFPQFQLIVFFDAAAGAVPSQGAGAADRVEAALATATGTTGPAAPTGVTP